MAVLNPREADLSDLDRRVLKSWLVEFDQRWDEGSLANRAQQIPPGSSWRSHGDVFAVGTSRMKPFPPVSPNGSRSLPSKRLSKGVNEWNHYYVRCINGEVWLWVNGEKVSGGSGCDPASGYLCLESEGSPVEFRQLRIRELPR